LLKREKFIRKETALHISCTYILPLTMSSVWNTVLSLAPYHLLSYGTLLGTQLYQVRELRLARSTRPLREALPQRKLIELTGYILELRRNQSMFSKLADAAIHDTPKTRVSHLFSTASWFSRPDGYLSPTDEFILLDRSLVGLCASRGRLGDLDVEHGDIWAENPRDND
jgi:hypothetical protein